MEADALMSKLYSGNSMRFVIEIYCIYYLQSLYVNSTQEEDRDFLDMMEVKAAKAASGW